MTGSALRLFMIRISLIVLSTCVLSSDAVAQVDLSESDIDIGGLVVEATAGWDGMVDRATPVPISLLISNYSERDIQGQVTLSDPINGHEVRLGDVFLGAGATRRVTTIQDMSNWYSCLVAVSDDEQILWRRDLALMTGRQFVSSVNFALVIDNSDRRLQLPGALPPTALPSVEVKLFGEQGRPIQCLQVKPWQVPNHPGPLFVAQAIIFPETTEDDLLAVCVCV